MVDFLQASFPWTAMGMAVAITIAYLSSKQEKQDDK